MGLKKITIVFLPDGTKSVKHLKVPRILFAVLILLFLSGTLALGWIIKDYLAVKSEVPRLSSLEKENTLQKTQLVILAKKIEQIGRKVVELKEFDKRLRVMVNLDQTDDNSQFLGVGGSDPNLSNPDANRPVSTSTSSTWPGWNAGCCSRARNGFGCSAWRRSGSSAPQLQPPTCAVSGSRWRPSCLC